MRRSSFLWVVVLLLVWWVLADLRAGVWVAGGLAVAVGLALRMGLGGRNEPRVRVLRLAAFAPYFLWQSVQGGWDVSRRALTPSLPLNPGLLSYSLSLPPGAPRVFLTNALSLLPGTFGADLRDDELRVHLLVAGPEAERRVRELETRVGRLFSTEGP